MTEIEKLNSKLGDIVKSYPEKKIVRIMDNMSIKGTSFYPGGKGLYLEDGNIEFPINGIMVLGQDFDNECNFHESVKRETELNKNSKAWNNIIYHFPKVGINMNKCFFTNAIMGLRIGKSKNTGVSVAFQHKKEKEIFLEECRNFFIEQLNLQKPKLIIGLGAQIPRFVSGCSNDLNELSHVYSYKDLNKKVYTNIKFTDTKFKTNLVFIHHPSSYISNENKIDELNTALKTFRKEYSDLFTSVK
jgi:hypothetical protein